MARFAVYWLEVALLAVAYYTTASFGLRLAPVSHIASPVWPPSGIALVVLTLFGFRLWPGIALGAFLINWSTITGPVDPVAAALVAAGITVGNTLEALLGAYLLRRFAGFDGALERLRDVVGLVVLAALLSTLVSATIGVACAYWGGVIQSANQLALAWRTWWIGDMISDLVLAPFLFVWWLRPGLSLPGPRIAEAGILLLAVVLFCWLVFASHTESMIADFPFILFPFLIWAALRFGMHGAVTAILVMSVIALAGTMKALGPFIRLDVGRSLSESLLMLQSFMAIVAITTLVLAANVTERKRAKEALAQSHEELEERVRTRTSELRQQTSLLQLLHAIAATANQAMAVEDAMQASIDLVCIHIGWPVGHVWFANETNCDELIPSTFWHLSNRGKFEAFQRGTLRGNFPHGAGLPGQVCLKRQPAWLDKLGTNPAFERAELAKSVGLRTGFAVPVLVGMEVAAVLEFFSTDSVPLDDSFLVAMGHLGNQLGRVVERSRARELLQESEARFRSVTQSAPEAIFTADQQGNILSWNKGAQTTFGYTEEQAVGQPLTMLMTERHREPIRLAVVERVSATPSRLIGRTQEFHGLRKDKSEFPLEISLSKWRTANGTFFSAIIRDITARKRAEESVKMSEAMFKGLFSSAPDALVVVTREGRIFRLNGQAEKTFGYREEEVLGESVECLIAQGVREQFVAHRSDYLSAAKPPPRTGPMELAARRKDGSEFPVDIMLGTLQTDRHQLLLATIRDITARKRAEEELQRAHDELELRVQERTGELAAANHELRRSEEYHRAISHLTSDFCFAVKVHPQGAIELDSVTEGFAKVTGYTLDEINERGGWGALVHPDDLPIISRSIAQWRARREDQQEIRTMRKDGVIRWLHYYSRPVTASEDGDVFSIIGAAQDVTERKRAEYKIRASLEEKEMLLREVHHRVKNNLQVISSLLTLQSQRIKDRQAQAIFKESQNRVKSIAAIHQKLVRSSDLGHIDFGDYIRNLVNDLFRSYGVDTDKIKLAIDVNGLQLGIDTAIPCGLIINELVTNALKHAFPEGKAGEIGIVLHPDGPDFYSLTVTDDGGRFPKDLDIHDTNSLGLQIVQALSQQLEGSLEVSTNGGTAFHIRFKELQYRERR
jgi:PAS domain S-box-containing protein